MSTQPVRLTRQLHRGPLSIIAVGFSLSLFLVVSFVLCIALGIVVPNGTFHRPWLQFLPGFTWLTWQSFLIGLVESFIYGWYTAVVFVPLYNLFARRWAAAAAN